MNVEDVLPPVGQATIFTKLVITVLKTIKENSITTASCVSGSAVLAEYLRRKELESFQPNDIDVFLPDRCIFDLPLGFHFILILQKSLREKEINMEVVKHPQAFNKKKESPNEYSDAIDIAWLFSFRVKLGLETTTPIQLIVIRNKQKQGQTFEHMVVSSFDFNIVRAVYDIDLGTITYPTETQTGFCLIDTWIEQRTYFMYVPKNKPIEAEVFKKRMIKYSERGFRFSGFILKCESGIYFIVVSIMLHVVSP
jgi:hypothetical protein